MVLTTDHNAVPAAQVAQEQLAEYAAEKSTSASAILQQAEALEATLQQLLAGSSSADAATPTQAVAAAMQQLKAQLAQAAVEAQAFAEQQQADVERAKRSSAQVCVSAPNTAAAWLQGICTCGSCCLLGDVVLWRSIRAAPWVCVCVTVAGAFPATAAHTHPMPV